MPTHTHKDLFKVTSKGKDKPDRLEEVQRIIDFHGMDKQTNKQISFRTETRDSASSLKNVYITVVILVLGTEEICSVNKLHLLI